MLIRITIDEIEPLSGTAAADDSGLAPRRFMGWLELLSAISALVDAAGRQGGANGEELEHGGAGGNGARNG